MKQEDKELLLKDLCARLPYGVKVHINSPIDEQNSMELFDVNLDSEHIGVGNEKWAFMAIPVIDDEDESKVVKPYLRPMSTMTMEERKELGDILNNCTLTPYGEIKASGEDNILRCTAKQSFLFLNYMYKKHFDINHLIDEGLALEAPEGMYDIKE